MESQKKACVLQSGKVESRIEQDVKVFIYFRSLDASRSGWWIGPEKGYRSYPFKNVAAVAASRMLLQS